MIGPTEVASLLAAGAAFVLPDLLDLGVQVPVCAPCNRQDVPGFDRWAIADEVGGFETASTLLLLGMGTAAELDLALRADGLQHAVVLAESAAWALGLASLLKAATGRARPVLYTDGITREGAGPDDLRSFPSAHTAGAFAVATSWWLSRRALDRDAPVPWWIGAVTAVGVGVMRVAAHRHFPSDVLAGAALGAGSAVLVHVIRF